MIFFHKKIEIFLTDGMIMLSLCARAQRGSLAPVAQLDRASDYESEG